MNRAVLVGLVSSCCLVGWATAGRAASAGGAAIARSGDDGRQILLERERRHRARSEEYLGELIVIAKNGKERRKEWRSYREGPAGSSNRLIRFLSPPDVRGVGYLAQARQGKSPDEWLYLPSMKRERRIGARDRDAAFVGTSFSYEDLDLVEFDDARYETALLPSQTVDGIAVYVIALVPRTRSAYAKKILKIRTDNLTLVAAEFFVDGESGPAKRLTLGDYAQVDGYLVAMRVEIADLRKGTRTILLLHDVALDRPQPRDRYTIQNLLREDDGGGAPVPAPPRSFMRRSDLAPDAAVNQGQTLEARLGAGASGYVEARGFGYFNEADLRHSNGWQWATVVARQTALLGPARITGAVRFEESSSPQVGPLVFDPADRNPRRSPASIRELSVVLPLRPGLDVKVGRFQVAWGETDGYSPADAFLPRDLSDPLTNEKLPLWGVSFTGELKGVRFELFVAPTTTPWRLPALALLQSPFSSLDIFLTERPWSVPRGGFENARVGGTIDGWDVAAWARAGVRPAPVLEPRLDIAERTDAGLFVQLDRHFTHESAVGAQLSREYGGWVIRSELGVFHSNDASLGDAVIATLGGSRIVRDGTFTATVATNAVAPPVNALLLFDRALLPAVILAIREWEAWGNWRAAWIGTFQTVGGVLSAEITKDLTDTVKVTAGADLPHGAALSPANVFSGGKRVRAALRFSW